MTAKPNCERCQRIKSAIERGCPADVAREENGWDECSADDCPMLPKFQHLQGSWPRPRYVNSQEPDTLDGTPSSDRRHHLGRLSTRCCKPQVQGVPAWMSKPENSITVPMGTVGISLVIP